MPITKEKKIYLRSQAHKLKPVVLIGSKGFTESVQTEIERALEDHELIKIKISGMEREDKQQTIQNICTVLNAELIQTIGHIAAIYRKSKKEK